MKNKYLYVLIVFLFVGSIFAQTTETFETEIDNSTSFTDNIQVFNISSQAGGTFDIANFPGTGWNGTAADNKYIDNSSFADIGVPVAFTIKSAGATKFLLKSVYLFLSQSDLNPGSGSCTITGKLIGSTVFTATSSTGFNSNILVNNGYTFIDLTSYGGANNSNAIIDEYVVTTTGTYEYVGLDAMKWEYDCSGLVAPTANAQIFCDAGTVANLVATGNSLKWYDDASGGSALIGTTALTTKTYYVTSNSIGCESARIPVSVTITPSSDNVTIVSACDSYTWNGTTYTTSGIKTGATANCVTEKLDLTITTTIAPTGTATQTFCGSETVSLLNATGTGIIWYNAATLGTVLLGSTILVSGTTYYASQTVSGCESKTRLAVTVTAGGCLGLDHFDASTLRLYPNPTTGILNINYSKNIEEVSVINLLGQTLFTHTTKATEVQLDLSKYPTATYFVKVVSEGKSKIIKVIKQ